jgi:hypothetical protein
VLPFQLTLLSVPSQQPSLYSLLTTLFRIPPAPTTFNHLPLTASSSNHPYTCQPLALHSLASLTIPRASDPPHAGVRPADWPLRTMPNLHMPLRTRLLDDPTKPAFVSSTRRLRRVWNAGYEDVECWVVWMIGTQWLAGLARQTDAAGTRAWEWLAESAFSGDGSAGGPVFALSGVWYNIYASLLRLCFLPYYLHSSVYCCC